MTFVDIKEFFVEGADHGASHVLLHLTEPSTADEIEKGTFFALVEILNPEQTEIADVQSYIDRFEKGYYEAKETEKISAFETMLQHLHHHATKIFHSSGSAFHCLLGTIKDGEIRLSAYGSPHAVVFYRHRDEWRRMPILEGVEMPAGGLFSTMLEGRINEHDILFLGTPGIADYFSYDRIEKMIESRGIAESRRHIEHVLSDMRHARSFGGIFMELLPEEEKPKTGRWKKSATSAAESLSLLLERQKETRATLFPPLGDQLSKVLADRRKKREDHHMQERPPEPRQKRNPSEPFFRIALLSLQRSILHGVIGLFFFLKHVSLLLVKGIIAGIILITNKNNGRAEILGHLKERREKIYDGFFGLSLLSKFLFGATLCAGLLFLGSIFVLNVKETRVSAMRAYQEQELAIVDKINAAEARLLYGNTDEAVLLFHEARQLIGTLDEKTEERREKKAQLSAQIEVHLGRLRKMTVVSPILLADIGETHADALPTTLAAIGKTLIAFGPADSALYHIDMQTGSITAENHTNIQGLEKATTPKEQNEILFLTTEDRIGRFDPATKSIEQKDIGYPEAETEITDLLVYNARLYTLDSLNQQIYKHTKTATGYDKGLSWLREQNPAIQHSISVAIDGDLFVLTQDGAIHKFTSGIEVLFPISPVDPALNQPTIIWTYTDETAIFLLDPKEKRVVVLDKNGSLLAQYTATEWIEPTGMVVMDHGKKVFILDGKKVYQFETTHD